MGDRVPRGEGCEMEMLVPVAFVGAAYDIEVLVCVSSCFDEGGGTFGF